MDDPSSINLITTSGPKKSTFCIGLFDFYKLVVIILTTISEKKTPTKNLLLMNFKRNLCNVQITTVAIIKFLNYWTNMLETKIRKYDQSNSEYDKKLWETIMKRSAFHFSDVDKTDTGN